MVQDCVDSLAEIGEWKAFLVGGRIEAGVHVQGNSSNGKVVQRYLTLDEIRYAFQIVQSTWMS